MVLDYNIRGSIIRHQVIGRDINVHELTLRRLDRERRA